MANNHVKIGAKKLLNLAIFGLEHGRVREVIALLKEAEEQLTDETLFTNANLTSKVENAKNG